MRGVLLDFYGTVVHDDAEAILALSRRIAASDARELDPNALARYWIETFFEELSISNGDAFRLQRTVHRAALSRALGHFGVTADADELAETLFESWRQPDLYPDARRFLDAVTLPVCVVSNIDRADLVAAIEHNGLELESLVTSEDVRSYKPRPECFAAGLDVLGLSPGEALHIGDSLISDIGGASRMGIEAAWVNRVNGKHPPRFFAHREIGGLDELLPDLGVASR